MEGAGKNRSSSAVAHQYSNGKAILSITKPAMSSYGFPGSLIRKMRFDFSL